MEIIALLREATADHMVWVQGDSPEESQYRIDNMDPLQPFIIAELLDDIVLLLEYSQEL